MTKEQWLAIRKEAAVKIDPETAEVFWGYGSVRDPYGLYDLTDEEDNIGRNYFARSPESEVWVVWRSTRKDPRRFMGKAQVTVSVSSRASDIRRPA